MVKLKKFGTLGGWIAKIETLVFELKNAVNFEGLNYNFSKLSCVQNVCEMGELLDAPFKVEETEANIRHVILTNLLLSLG